MKEIYKDIEGYEGIYQVSNFGNVKSLEREASHSAGGFRIVKERILKLTVRKDDVYVGLKGDKIKTIKVCRLVADAFLECGISRDTMISRMDLDISNNKLSNLKLVPKVPKARRARESKSSSYKGVCWCKRSKKWKSYINIKGKVKNLGYFKDELEASKPYQKALKELKN